MVTVRALSGALGAAGPWAGMLVPACVRGPWEMKPRLVGGRTQVREERQGCCWGGSSSCRGSEGGVSMRWGADPPAGPHWVPGSSEHPSKCPRLLGSEVGTLERSWFAAKVVMEALETQTGGGPRRGHGVGSRKAWTQKPVVREEGMGQMLPRGCEGLSPVHLAHLLRGCQ